DAVGVSAWFLRWALAVASRGRVEADLGHSQVGHWRADLQRQGWHTASMPRLSTSWTNTWPSLLCLLALSCAVGCSEEDAAGSGGSGGGGTSTGGAAGAGATGGSASG